MARKPTLSPTKLTTYLACPVKYRWTYVDSRGNWYLRAKSYYSFGTTLHKVLERFHDSGDLGVETTFEALAAYEESWLDAGFSSAEEMAEAYGEGKQIIQQYIEDELAAGTSSTRTLYVEKLFKKDMGDFVLVGRLDRVDEHEDGLIEVVDYKTQRTHISEEDVASDIAMACYQVLLREAFPGRSVRATLHSLKNGMRASYSMSAEECAEFEFDLKELARKIMSHDYYELVPVHRRLCYSCDFLPLCRKHHEFDEPDALRSASSRRE